jgi:hypothetical protein
MDHELYLKGEWNRIQHLPVLTIDQIKDIDDDCARMYLYCYYNYPEFYNYTEKLQLSRHITAVNYNLTIFATYIGNLKALQYLYLKGVDFNYKPTDNINAYMVACTKNSIEVIKFLETTNIDIYQVSKYGNAYSFSWCSTTRTYLENKFLYTGFSKAFNKNCLFIPALSTYIFPSLKKAPIVKLVTCSLV